jgi:hypothetical protein
MHWVVMVVAMAVKSMVMLVMVGWAMSEGEGELMWVVGCGVGGWLAAVAPCYHNIEDLTPIHRAFQIPPNLN